MNLIHLITSEEKMYSHTKITSKLLMYLMQLIT